MSQKTLIVLSIFAVVVPQVSAQSQPMQSDTCRVSVTPNTEVPISRSVTWNFNDQARASIAALYPQSRILAERRAGNFGKIEYSLMVYQKTPADSVRLDVLAVNREAQKLWYLSSTCTLTSWPVGMITLLEATAGLQFPR